MQKKLLEMQVIMAIKKQKSLLLKDRLRDDDDLKEDPTEDFRTEEKLLDGDNKNDMFMDQLNGQEDVNNRSLTSKKI